jgi:uncharacterized protein (TIGR02611 family)
VAHDEDASAPVDVSPRPVDRAEEPPRPGIRDRYLRRTRTTRLIYRFVVGIVGTLVIALGIVLLPLPGPGWLVIFAGLAILASEFTWAERLLDYARDKVLAWTHWVGRQALGIRLLIGAACVVIVAAALFGYFEVVGVPGWLPDGPERWLNSLLP